MGLGNDLNASEVGFMAVDDDLLKTLGIIDSETTCAESDCCGECDDCDIEVREFGFDDCMNEIEVCDKQYAKIMKDAYLGPWSKSDEGEKGQLYSFTKEQLADLDINRAFLKACIRSLIDAYNELFEEYMAEETVPVADRILRSGDATIVFWDDGTKTIVKKSPDEPDSDYIAFTAALGKKIYGSNSKLSRFVKSKIEYQKPKEKKQIAEEKEEVRVSFDDMIWTSMTTTADRPN